MIEVCNDDSPIGVMVVGGNAAKMRSLERMRLKKERRLTSLRLARQIAAANLGWMERGCRAEALVSSMQCQHARPRIYYVGRWDQGTLTLARWAQAGAGIVAARAAENDSDGTRSVTESGPPPEPPLNQRLLYLQSAVAAAFGAVRYF